MKVLILHQIIKAQQTIQKKDCLFDILHDSRLIFWQNFPDRLKGRNERTWKFISQYLSKPLNFLTFSRDDSRGKVRDKSDFQLICGAKSKDYSPRFLDIPTLIVNFGRNFKLEILLKFFAFLLIIDLIIP